MKTKIKQLTVIIALLLLCVVFLSCIGGCTPQKNDRIYETEYFRCINYEWEDFVTILELTELGKQQEVLVIPDKLNGSRVGRIGGYLLDEQGDKLGLRAGYELESTKIKKIYFKYTPDIEINSSHFYESSDLEIVVLAAKQDLDKATNICSQRFTFYGNVENAVEEHNGRFVNKCNVFFYLNGDSEEQPYWFDIINDDNLYILPETPSREGYVFEGWYYDKDANTPWNEKYEILNNSTQLILFAKWSEK